MKLIDTLKGWLWIANTKVTLKDKPVDTIDEQAYIDEWYIYMYHDMNMRTIFIKKCNTYEEKVIHREKVIEEFWHLLYFFKKDLLLWETKKLSSAAFKRGKVKQDILDELEVKPIEETKHKEETIEINFWPDNTNEEDDKF